MDNSISINFHLSKDFSEVRIANLLYNLFYNTNNIVKISSGGQNYL